LPQDLLPRKFKDDTEPPCYACLDIILCDPQKDLLGNGLWIGRNDGGPHNVTLIYRIYDYFQRMQHYIERSSYLQLKTVVDPHFDRNNVVHRYLFDAMVAREICTFMVHETHNVNLLL
jgi:hypothetical protein